MATQQVGQVFLFCVLVWGRGVVSRIGEGETQTVIKKLAQNKHGSPAKLHQFAGISY